MKRWALLTVGLYVLILLLLAGPVLYLGFVDLDDAEELLVRAYCSGPLLPVVIPPDSKGFEGIFVNWSLWGGVLVMALSQVALLVVPVRIVGRRPVTTRWLIWPLLAALVMLVLLTTAMLLVVFETVAHTKALANPTMQIMASALVLAIWAIWAFIFAFYTIRGGRQNFMKRLVRSLIVGSILELLVAVPAHVLARTRNYCCAGFGTFWGIASGISVMLFAFGPAVFVLFARRYGDLRHRRAVKAPAPCSPSDGGEKSPG